MARWYRYRSAIPRYVIERCPSPLPFSRPLPSPPPPSPCAPRFDESRDVRKENMGFGFLYRVVVDSLPGKSKSNFLSLSIEWPVNERFLFFPPPSCIHKCMFSSISICLIIIIIILESFLFFFFLFLSSLTSVASIDEIIEEEISPRSYCKRVQEDRLRGLIIIE